METQATQDRIKAHLRLVAGHYNTARAWLVAERTARQGLLTEAEAEAVIGSPKPAADVLRAENAAWTAERDAQRADPPEGPGTELKAVLASWGYSPKPDCPCLRKMGQMNRWKAAGCRKNRWTIIGWLKDAAADNDGWMAWAADKLGVIPGMVDQAIDRAEAKEKAAAKPTDRANGGGG